MIRISGISDLDPETDYEYYSNYDECKKEFSAFLSCLSHYLFTHGYRMIEEEKFKEKLQTFYEYKWCDFENEGDFYSCTYGKRIHNKPDFIVSLEKQAIIDSYSNSISLKIKGEQYDNDGYYEDTGEEINRRMNMDSFVNGELEFDVDWDLFLNQHLYLFNNSKAAKTWLLCHRMDFFFYNLNYYDEDDEINRKKLDYIKSKCINDKGEIILGENKELVRKSLYGHHNNIMKLIFEETDKAMSIYEKEGVLDLKEFDLLYNYFIDMYAPGKHFPESRKIDFLEHLCRFLKMEVTLNKKHCISNNSGWFNDSDALSIAFQCLNDTLIEVAKQHNYYDIPNFDEVLKVYKWDSENCYRDKSGIPFDYTSLLSE